jgi:hypothetical protein
MRRAVSPGWPVVAGHDKWGLSPIEPEAHHVAAGDDIFPAFEAKLCGREIEA